MFKALKNKQGQGMMVQYALTFFFVVAVITAMTNYFKRTLQGRIRDATVYMVKTVHNVHGENMYAQYEPYYTNSLVDREVYSDRDLRLLPSDGRTSGIFGVAESTNTTTTSISNQLPPYMADQ